MWTFGKLTGVEKAIFCESITLLPSNSKTLTFRTFKIKSQVWKHFEISDGDSSLVICKICNTRISRGSLKCSTSYNTNNMRKHILSKHREVSLAQESIPCTSKPTAPGVRPSITVAL